MSLALLLASRILGLVRESVQAAAFGASGWGDVVVLMLTLPDWLTGILASGALAYVLVPAWARTGAPVAAIERRVGAALLAGGALVALALVLCREPAVRWLAPGVPADLAPLAGTALAWSALAVPAALLAALWTVRLQHERDYGGMYASNLVVNVALIGALWWAGFHMPRDAALTGLGAGLALAMVLRLAWLMARKQRFVHGKRAADQPQPAQGVGAARGFTLPRASVWIWAALLAGLPLALPFAARSIASQSASGALATFNYAWKLVELPLVLAIQLVAALAFPGIAGALATGEAPGARRAIRGAFALAWALACAATAALVVASPALAQLLFGWGAMEPRALARIAEWAGVGAWTLLPQSLIAVALTVLAARARMRPVVAAYALALGALGLASAWGWSEGVALMVLLGLLLALIAVVALLALGSEVRSWLPWRGMAAALAALLVLAAASAGHALPFAATSLAQGLVAAGLSASLVLGLSWWGSADLREALRR